jgi:hypothetical protein
MIAISRGAIWLILATPHWFGVVDEPVELILTIGPEGEQAHLH